MLRLQERTRDAAENQKPLMKLMLGEWHIKGTAQMTFGPDVTTLFELRLRKCKGQAISLLASTCRARHLIWETKSPSAVFDPDLSMGKHATVQWRLGFEVDTGGISHITQCNSKSR
jgi:hypothetical protein